jgi:hypothetical protein
VIVSARKAAGKLSFARQTAWDDFRFAKAMQKV